MKKNRISKKAKKLILKSYKERVKRNLKKKQEVKRKRNKKLQKIYNPVPVNSFEEAADYMMDKYDECDFYDVKEYVINNRKICKVILDNFTGVFHTVYFDITKLIKTEDRLDTIETGITGFTGYKQTGTTGFTGYKQTGTHFFDTLMTF